MPIRYFVIPTLALIAGVGAAQAADLDYQIHGFASQGYVVTDGAVYEEGWFGRDTNESGTLEFNEFGLNVVATPIEHLRVGAQFIAYDLGKYGNNELQIDWAFGEYQIPVTDGVEVSVVAGRFKTGHAFYNDYRDLDMTRALVFLPRSVYSVFFRDFYLAANGAQLNANIDAGPAGSFIISGFLGTQNLDEDEGPLRDIIASGINQPRPAFIGSTDFVTPKLKEFDSLTVDKFNGAHFEWNTPMEGLRLKASALYADNMEASGTMVVTLPANLGGATSSETSVDFVVDHWFDVTFGAEYVLGDFTIASEVASRYFTIQAITGPLDFPGALPDSPASAENLASRSLGTYISASYQLSCLPGAWKRLSACGAFNWDRTTDTYANTNTYLRSGAIALRYDIVDHFLVKAEFERVQETSASAIHSYGNIFALKTTFDF